MVMNVISTCNGTLVHKDLHVGFFVYAFGEGFVDKHNIMCTLVSEKSVQYVAQCLD